MAVKIDWQSSKTHAPAEYCRKDSNKAELSKIDLPFTFGLAGLQQRYAEPDRSYSW